MRHRYFVPLCLLALWAPAYGGAPPASAAPVDSRQSTRSCPDDHVLVDTEPLVSGGRRMGAARLYSGVVDGSGQASPGFCFEVSIKPRYRRPLAPLRKKLTVASPLTDGPNVVGTTESARRQFPLASYASFYGPGCSAVAKAVLRVDGRRATAIVRGAL